MPSADFCFAFKNFCKFLSFNLMKQKSRSPGVIISTFCTQPLEFTVPALDGYGLYDLTLICPTFPPDIQYLFVGSHICYILPSDPASQLRPCISLAFTSIRLAEELSSSKLTCMPGTRDTARLKSRGFSILI